MKSGFQRKREMLFDLQRRAQPRGQEVDRRRFEDIIDAVAIDRAGIDQPVMYSRWLPVTPSSEKIAVL